MNMDMGMSMSPRQDLRITQKIEISLPMYVGNWSLIEAFNRDKARGFEYPLKLKKQKIPDFESLDHDERMRRIDEANEVFRYAYVRGTNTRTGRNRGYYKIPLLRDLHIDPDEIKRKISKEEYERAQAILQGVSKMERIAYAIPYHHLLQDVREHLEKQHGVGLKDTVLVGVDRGGHLPAMILQRALNHSEVFFLKINQGGGAGNGGELDMDRLNEFVSAQTFKGRHVLFIDSTVDSGRQIGVLEQFFDNPEWQKDLGHRSWSIVGSNEDGKNLHHHQNINWGVDPDQTFEDNPLLMGVDYAPGSLVKVIECPSETSEKIRQVIFEVPAGNVFDLTNIEDQIEKHRKKIRSHKDLVRTRIRLRRDIEEITSGKRWKTLLAQPINFGPAPGSPINHESANSHSIVVIGASHAVEAPSEVFQFLAQSLGGAHKFSAGTSYGNPGAMIAAIRNNFPDAKIKIFDQEGEGEDDDLEFEDDTEIRASMGGVRERIKRKMIKQGDRIVTLGGRSGTLSEVVMALQEGKQTFAMRTWGPIVPMLLSRKSMRDLFQHLKICDSVEEMTAAIVESLKS